MCVRFPLVPVIVSV
jgi:hypothetical protein